MSLNRKFRTRTTRAGITVTNMSRVCYRSIFDGICFEYLSDKTPAKTHTDILDKIIKIELGEIHIRNTKFVLEHLNFRLETMERLQMVYVHGSQKELKKG